MAGKEQIIVIHACPEGQFYEQWAADIAAGAFHIDDGCYAELGHVGYADELEPGTELHLRGRWGQLCVKVHALHLGDGSQMIQNGLVQVVIDKAYTEGLNKSPVWIEEVQVELDWYYQQTGIRITLE